jgi:hypothetical protein
MAVTRRPARDRPVGGLRFANPPYELLSRRLSLFFFLLLLPLATRFFCLPPDRGVGGAPTAARVPAGTRDLPKCVAGQAPGGVPASLPELGFARVRHSMSGRSRIYPTSAGGRRASRRSTVAILGRGPRFLLRHFLRIRTASSSQPGRSAWRAGPRTSRACSCEPQPRDATPRSTFRIASRRRPS